MKRSVRVGVDIGGTRIKAARIVDGAVAQRRVVQLTAADRSTKSLVAAVAAVTNGLANGAAELGVGIAAMVSGDGESIVASPNMSFLDGFALAAELRDATGLAVEIDNDVNVIALGEALAGAGRGVRDMVCLALGTGLGGAIVRNGVLRRGARGQAGELGHLVVDPNGPACGCGGRGCAEQYASQKGLQRLIREANWQSMTHTTPDDNVIALFHAAARGDHVAQTLVRRAGWALGVAIGWCCEMFAPQRIVIAGGISAAWPQLSEAALSALHCSARPSALCRSVEVGSLGADAGTIGAALLFEQDTQMRR